jgi:hypothetical protein
VSARAASRRRRRTHQPDAQRFCVRSASCVLCSPSHPALGPVRAVWIFLPVVERARDVWPIFEGRPMEEAQAQGGREGNGCVAVHAALGALLFDARRVFPSGRLIPSEPNPC